MTTRRHLLKLLAGGGAAYGAGMGASPVQFQFAPAGARAATPGKTLIKVFLRGGADGLNLFPPYAENNYYNLRPNIAVPAPNGSDPNAALRLTNFFGMHPALAPFMEIWDNGDLGVAPATHMPGVGRSHFDNQRWMELGYIGTGASGYFGRYLEQNPPAGLFQALVAGATGVPVSMTGSVPVTAVRSASDFKIEDAFWCAGNNCEDNRYHSMLSRLYADAPATAGEVEQTARLKGRDMAEKLSVFEGFSDNYSASAGGLDYSNSSFGDALRMTAQVVKANVGLEVVAMNWTVGWDTHSGQLPAGVSHGNMGFGYHNRINQGANDILTFYRDVQAANGDVTMILGTEFGRTAKQNGSRGTDHGHAGAWMAIGGAVQGGFHGAWPGLGSNQLHQGRFLARTVDYRDLMGEAMVRFLGTPENQIASIFPDHNFTDVGMFAGAGV